MFICLAVALSGAAALAYFTKKEFSFFKNKFGNVQEIS